MTAVRPGRGLSDEQQASLSASVLCWLATADAEGRPSVSPKEIFVVTSATEILIAHIASPHSVRNIEVNPDVCVAAVDIFEQRGVQAYGRAEVIRRDDPRFAEVAAPLVEIAEPAFHVGAAIRVVVREARPLAAPSLWKYPDADPALRRDGVLRAYGVRDADRAAEA